MNAMLPGVTATMSLDTLERNLARLADFDQAVLSYRNTFLCDLVNGTHDSKTLSNLTSIVSVCYALHYFLILNVQTVNAIPPSKLVQKAVMQKVIDLTSPQILEMEGITNLKFSEAFAFPIAGVNLKATIELTTVPNLIVTDEKRDVVSKIIRGELIKILDVSNILVVVKAKK
jgi:hypothetical protein